MDPLTMALIGGGIGLGKSILFDQPKEERQRKLAAETQRYSPWTGLTANKIQEADPLGSALQFGTTGASMAAGMNQAEMDNALKQAQIDNLEARSNYWNRINAPNARPVVNTGANIDLMDYYNI